VEAQVVDEAYKQDARKTHGSTVVPAMHKVVTSLPVMNMNEISYLRNLST